ncbi:hypothetical protein AB0G29_35040 [Streptomyces parvus]|uniref:hypothetical protein n=1 Tax=Streptomyces parvus TaxID=66428 RepID=UPI0033DF1761
MSVGFRPTPEDSEIIRAHQRPDESTSDVLRRALRALDRERWDQQARTDMDRITAAGEDLSDEPDEWGYDDIANTVDLRTKKSSPQPESHSALEEMRLREIKAMEEFSSPTQQSLMNWLYWKGNVFSELRSKSSAHPLKKQSIPYENVFTEFALRPHLLEGLGRLHCDLDVEAQVAATAAAATMAARAAVLPTEDRLPARQVREDRHPATWKLAHLRAAARRRAGKR